MRRVVFVALALVVVVAAAALFMFIRMSPPDDLDLARSKPTVNGVFQVSIAPEAEPVTQGQLHSWILTVTTGEGEAIEGAEIEVDGGMPQHGHGLPTSPAVTGYLGEGRYRVEGVRFNMSGWWEIKLAISAGGQADTVVFNLVL